MKAASSNGRSGWRAFSARSRRRSCCSRRLRSGTRQGDGRTGILRFQDQLVYILAMRPQTPAPSARGRPRSFDVEAAVERAMDVFWSRGYHATALPDLLRATRLSRGSLYAAFGDKHSLFLRALDRYIADALTRMDNELARSREPVLGLRAYLAGYVDRTSGGNGRRGCLLVATVMELAGRDADVDRRV